MRIPATNLLGWRKQRCAGQQYVNSDLAYLSIGHRSSCPKMLVSKQRRHFCIFNDGFPRPTHSLGQCCSRRTGKVFGLHKPLFDAWNTCRCTFTLASLRLQQNRSNLSVSFISVHSGGFLCFDCMVAVQVLPAGSY